MSRDTRSDDPRRDDSRQQPSPDRSSEARRIPIALRGRTYRIRDSERHMLEAIGTFRVVAQRDLERYAPDGSTVASDLRSLSDQGIVRREHIDAAGGDTTVFVLTSEGKSLLEADRATSSERPQRYHAGLVKPRELAHDVQLYRVYHAEATRIQHAGGRIVRVVLDYEMKREYQRFLNRRDRASLDDDRRTFAHEHKLPIVRGHLEIPDLRIEYETEDGRLEHRDVEFVTRHYSRAQMAGKRVAGFALYRAAGASGRTGGTPHDPRHVERLL